MESESMKNYFTTLERQRENLFPKLQTLTRTQLWQRPKENKWSIGESIYHLFLMMRTFRYAAIFTIPCTKVYARVVRKNPFKQEIHDIYKEYQQKQGKRMKAPFVLNPPNKIRNKLDFQELSELLEKETAKVVKIVEDVEEDIAGHIIFFDPVASYPNLIQGIQLLAIHEAHHFRIIEKDFEGIKE